MELSQYRCDVIRPPCTGYHPRGSVLHRIVLYRIVNDDDHDDDDDDDDDDISEALRCNACCARITPF